MLVEASSVPRVIPVDAHEYPIAAGVDALSLDVERRDDRLAGFGELRHDFVEQSHRLGLVSVAGEAMPSRYVPDEVVRERLADRVHVSFAEGFVEKPEAFYVRMLRHVKVSSTQRPVRSQSSQEKIDGARTLFASGA